MMVLYILLSILLSLIMLITLILFTPVGAVFDHDGKTFRLYVKFGPVKIRVLPSKKKKRYKKLMRRLRGQRLSDDSLYTQKKKKKNNKDNHKKSDSAKITDLIKEIARNTDDPEGTNEWLSLIRIYAQMFKKDLHTELVHCYITVDEGDAAATCIRVGIISQAIAYLIEFLNVSTSFVPPDNGKIYVNPSFDQSGYSFIIMGKLRIRVFSVVKPKISLLFKSLISDIKK